ncbi:MAG: FAD-binding protein, partial [Myxococcota bacterium]
MDRLTQRLSAIVGERACLTRHEELFVYECDGLTLEGALPSVVVLPSETRQVVEVVRACLEAGRPFVPRGAGTGLSGGAQPVEGAVVIECSRMNRILDVKPEDRIAVVQPGVVNADLSSAIARHGLFFAPDPSSQLVCTIGGNVAENSG